MRIEKGTASAEKPLQGAVLCCTSIPPEQRTHIAECAEQMGADHELDLTSRVTHLLVGEAETEKYQYVAREREDVKVLNPGWVDAVRQCWMEDRPLDLHALELSFKLPTLFGLKICITGFEDLSFRAQLQRSIEEHGGKYTGELTKDNTHLIASVPTGKKYEYATLWQLKVVSIKWYRDTLERGMQLDETKYHPSLPEEQQGIGAWNRQARVKLGKRQRDDSVINEPSRKLRRTASARFGSQNDTLWSEISRPSQAESEQPQREPLRPTKSMPNLHDDTKTTVKVDANEIAHSSNTARAASSAGFLNACHFLLFGFDAKKLGRISDVLLGHGAVIHDTMKELVEVTGPTAKRYVLVFHETERKRLGRITSIPNDVEMVTELWLEWCMTLKRTVPISEYPIGRLVDRIALPQASKLTVNATGFQGIQILHVSKALARLGIAYEETFTPNTNVLICCGPSVNVQKIVHAKQWQIPIVSEKWCWRLLQDERIPSYGPFLLHKPKGQGSNRTENRFMNTVMANSVDARNPSCDENISKPKISDVVQDRKPGHKHMPFEESDDEHEAASQEAPTPEAKLNASTKSSPKKQPLKEISPNPQSKQPTPDEQKHIPTLDGTSRSDTNAQIDENAHTSPDKQAQPPRKDHSDLVHEFLQIKAEAKAKAVQQQNNPKPNTKKRLIGRALSNLSNSSRTPNNATNAEGRVFSRTSSINSLNTDGLGDPLSAQPWPPSRQNSKSVPAALSLDDLFNPINKPTIDHMSDPNLCRENQNIDPSQHYVASQVTYEDSAEAIALKARLAEKRRAKGRLGQKLGDPPPELERVPVGRPVIRDDEAALGKLGRVTTRGRGKVLEALERRDSFFD